MFDVRCAPLPRFAVLSTTRSGEVEWLAVQPAGEVEWLSVQLPGEVEW